MSYRLITALGFLIVLAGLLRTLTADPAALSGDEILARIESETNRRHMLLEEYSGSREYKLQNQRFGSQAAASVVTNFTRADGERYTVVARSGSERLSAIIDRVLASEAGASAPPENVRHEVTSANYRVRLHGIEAAAGRRCYVLALTPRTRNRFLIVGRIWVDAGTYGIVRLEGNFAASVSVLVGAPRISEEFIEVQGFWLPAHVRSVASSFLLGPTELEIQFSNYQVEQVAAAPE